MKRTKKPKILVIISIIITFAFLLFLLINIKKGDLTLVITSCFIVIMSILLIFPVKDSKTSNIIALMLICLTGYNAYTFALPDTNVKTISNIKDLRGLSYNEMLEYCKTNNIEVIEKYDYSDYIKKNYIINQNIINEDINNVTQLEFLISKGPNYDVQVSIPSFVGENIESLSNYIETNFLNNISIKFINSDNEPNIIISQSKTGKIRRNDNIIFEVSKDVFKEIQMIDLTGKSLFDAKLWLEKNSINYELEYDYNDISRNYVFDQNISVDTTIKEEDKVKLYISKGKSIIVPNLMEMSKEKITQWVNDNKLEITFTEEYNKDYEIGKVINSNYKENDKIEEGTVVTICISKGSLKMIKFTSLIEFKSWASENNVKYEINYSFSDSVSKGNLIKCSHSEGDTIANEDTVILTISNGKAISVPNFKGMKKTDIENKCKSLGLNCSFTYYGYTVATAKDIGVTQSINASKSVTSGTYIKISLSSGIAKTYTVEINETDLVINNANKTIESLKKLFSQKYPGVTFNFVTKASNTYNNAGFIHENSGVKNGTKVTQGKSYTVIITN